MTRPAMLKVVLRGLAARRGRTASSMVAVGLGVAMISGTFVLMDTVMSAYAGIFRAAYVHTDVVVVAQSPFGATGTAKPAVPASLLAWIRGLPEVARAHGYVDAHAQLTDATGTPIGKSSEEASLFGVPTGELDAMNPLTLVAGAWPRGEGQVIVDEATAEANHLQLGATVGLVARKPLERYRVVGIFRFAGAANMGPTQFVAADLAVAQRIFDKQGLLDEIDVAARAGVPVAALTGAIRKVAPRTAKVSTAAAQAATATSDVGRQFDLLRYVLLAFGLIALFVGSFIIFNTLSITVTQRTRELATLRTLGASRGQVLAWILTEGGVIGLGASVAGVGAGVGFAKGLNALFASSGVHLPGAGTVLEWRTVAVSLGAGVLMTQAASLMPGLRAMRIAPVVAMREGTERPAVSSAAGRVAVLSLLAAGGGVTASTLLIGGLPTTTRLVLLAAGALVLFAGVAGAARWAIPALAAAIGRPVERFTQVAGKLAREESARHPARTAITAGALTVGVALVAFVSVVSQGLRASTGQAIRHQVTADFVVTPQHDVLAPDVQRALAAAGITDAGVRSGIVHVFGDNQTMTGVVPADLARFWHFDWTAGSGPYSLFALDDAGVLVAGDFAAAHHLAPGSTVSVQTGAGSVLRLIVRGVYRAPKLASLLGTMTVTTSLFDRSFPTPGDQAIYVHMPAGATPFSKSIVAGVLRDFTTARITTLAGFITSQEATISTLLNIFYVLLALSVIISLFGIVNTLALSIAERTREIGMLRAVGMTRRQLRRMVRIESEIIALIGAGIGIALGLALASLTALALSGWNLGFSVPWTTLTVLLAVSLVAGTLASLAPARRATRLDLITAISHE